MANLVLVEKRGSVQWIILNNEKRLNAINGTMYKSILEAMDQANIDDDIKITVLTGKGKYYSAGNDFSMDEIANASRLDNDDCNPFKLWVDRLIRHKKPVIALVNGPAIGIAVTTLSLCDAVFASDTATFVCPFTQIGLNPEGCSSETFAQIMGYQKAAQLALFSEKMTAEEMYIAGMVSKVIPHAQFEKITGEIVERYSKLAKQSLLASKRLLRPESTIDRLMTVNRHEYEVLQQQMVCEETNERLLAKFAKPSKSKL